MVLNEAMCECNAAVRLAPCWNCENNGLICNECELTIEEIDDMTNPTSGEFDVITLIQLEEGVQIVAVRVIGEGKKIMRFKTAIKDIAEGDGVIVARGNGSFDVGEVTSVDEEIQAGVTYCWVVDRVDLAHCKKFANFDASIKKRIAVGKATEAARAAIGVDLNGVKLIPNGDG